MDNELWVILLPITLLPVFFAMGWFAARIDMKTVLKQAKKRACRLLQKSGRIG